MSEKIEAVRVTRLVRSGTKVHRLTAVLESESSRPRARHYVDEVFVDPEEFDRIVRLMGLPEDHPGKAG